MRSSSALRFLWKQDLTPYIPSRRVSGAGVASSYIGGEFVVGSGKAIPIESPSDEIIVTDMKSVSVGEVNAAVEQSRVAFREQQRQATVFSGTTTPSSSSLQSREAVLHGISKALKSDAENLAVADALCGGICIKDARASVLSAVECFKSAAVMLRQGALNPMSVPKGDLSFSSSCVYEPVGVVGLITPFNYPLEMFAWKAAPAIAAGNTIVWKPPEVAPLSSFVVMEVIRGLEDSGVMAKGTIQVVQGGVEVGKALASHDDVDMVAFTGSTNGGRDVQIAAANSNLKRVQLELGGNGCTLVGQSAHLQTIVEVAMQCFTNSGQSCTSSRRLFVPKKRLDEVVPKLIEAAAIRAVGHALDPKTEQGPLISAASLHKALTVVKETSCSEGISLIAGGFRVPFAAGHFMSPTILLCNNKRSTIVTQELFAPVLCVIPYEGDLIDVAVQEANSTKYGLSAVVVSEDHKEIEAAVALLDAGTVWVNTVDTMSGWTPFGGFKQSGYGKDLGVVSVQGYSRLKTVTRR